MAAPGSVWSHPTRSGPNWRIQNGATRQPRCTDALMLDFLWSTYAAAAEAGGSNRAQLECALGAPRQVRPARLLRSP